MPQSLDKVWTDLSFELEAIFSEIRQATNWPAHFDSTDLGPNITTPALDQCWVTRNQRTVVVCKMRLMSRPEGEHERTFQFRLDAAAALPVIRIEGDTVFDVVSKTFESLNDDQSTDTSLCQGRGRQNHFVDRRFHLAVGPKTPQRVASKTGQREPDLLLK